MLLYVSSFTVNSYQDNDKVSKIKQAFYLTDAAVKASIMVKL